MERDVFMDGCVSGPFVFLSTHIKDRVIKRRARRKKELITHCRPAIPAFRREREDQSPWT